MRINEDRIMREKKPHRLTTLTISSEFKFPISRGPVFDNNCISHLSSSSSSSSSYSSS
jgi:hypothetical protein